MSSSQRPGRGFVLTRKRRSGVPLVGTWAITAGLGVATAALIVFQWRPVEVPPLPAYGETFSGGEGADAAATPGQESSAVRLRPWSVLDWQMTPENDAGPVVVRGYLIQRGKAQPWAPAVEISSAGEVRVHGSVRDLGIPPGESKLVLTVVRGREKPTGWRVLFAAARSEGDAPESSGFAHTVVVEE